MHSMTPFACVQPGSHSSLALQGEQCVGERHAEVIARQREAIVELRAKLNLIDKQGSPQL